MSCKCLGCMGVGHIGCYVDRPQQQMRVCLECVRYPCICEKEANKLEQLEMKHDSDIMNCHKRIDYLEDEIKRLLGIIETIHTKIFHPRGKDDY